MSEQIVPPTPDELLAAAERYASAGLKIYPVFIRGLKPDGKKDVYVPISSWYNATNDLEQVRAWWGGQYRGAGIGCDMGGSKLAVGDGDTHDGGVERLRSELGGWPEWITITPSGGVHAWFADPDGVMGTGAKLFSENGESTGVDGRGVGGTIFMAPTFVPGYGQYRWANGEPDWSALPRVPERLAAACPPGGRKREQTASTAPVTAGPFALPSSVGAPAIVHRDRAKTLEQAKADVMPLWEAIRDTRPPNGLWQAVADFSRLAAHYQCFWDQAAVERQVLAAYEAGGHGYTTLDGGDLRAIANGFRLQREARDAGDLDNGWAAYAAPDLAEAVETAPEDAVEALLAEMLTPEQLEALPPPTPLIDGLLNLDSESWIIGPPGGKKSFVALDMAGAVSTGRQWQGRDVLQGTVVMIIAEGSAGIGKRMKAYRQVHGALGRVHVLPRPVQAKDMGAWAVLVKACERLGPALVVVDTQHRVTVGLEENSATDMGYYIQAVGAIRKATGACVLTVHHTGRKGGDARGSSALDGAQDTELTVVPDPGQKLRAQLKITKQKELEEGDPIRLAFKICEVGTDAKGQPITSLSVLRPDMWDAAEIETAQREDWELHWQGVALQIVRVLADQGGDIGLTEEAARDHVAGRFYGGRLVRSAPAGELALRKSTFRTAWVKVIGSVNGDGDPIVTESGGRRYALDPIASKGYAPSPD